MSDNANASGGSGSGSAENLEGTSSDNVSVETHKRLLAQRKADQERARRLEEENNALKAAAEAAEVKRLEDEKRYKELYEAEKKKREESEGKITQMSQSQIESAKKSALKDVLGNIKAEYLKFADLAAIRMNDDGTPDTDSVKDVANKFRQSYPELLPVKSAGGTIPSGAPADFKPAPAKPLSQMSAEELRQALHKTRSAAK